MVTKRPEARHVVVDGEHFAEIDGKRYPMKRIEGVWCLSQEDVAAIAERHAPPEVREALARDMRRALAERFNGSERLQ